MQTFFFFLEPEKHDLVWLAPEAPTVRVFTESLGAHHLAMPRFVDSGNKIAKRLARRKLRQEFSEPLCAEVRQNLSAEGPNILFHMAFTPADIYWLRLLEPVWQEFSHRILYINDTIQPQDMNLDDLEYFDEVIFFCADLADAFSKVIKTRVSYWPANCDVLNYYSVGAHRPLDLILVGRREAHWHEPLHRYFNDPERDRIFVDFLTRTQGRQPLMEQFSVLMATYGRSKGAFCYESSNVPRFRGRSPLLNRWIHAWAAGCAVFGTLPFGKGVAEEINWTDSIIELPEDIGQAIETVDNCLSDADRMAQLRVRNVTEAMARHDTRVRLRDLLNRLDAPLPATLSTELDALDAARETVLKSAGV